MPITRAVSDKGIPIKWESEITLWEPPCRFADEQRRGPYRMWRHEHPFVEREGGTDVGDRVKYAVWGGSVINSLLVAPDMQKIFEFRMRQIAEVLLPPAH